MSSLYGEASDGEVEDYRFTVVEHLKDYGDAPNGTSALGTPQSYPVTEIDGGAWHSTNNTTVYLGTVAPDSELDAVPSYDANTDDLVGITDDEDGADLAHKVFIADGTTTNSITVTASSDVGGTAYLNAWFDLNADGDWDDAGEHIIVGTDTEAEFDFSSVSMIKKTFTLDPIAPLTNNLEQAVSYLRLRFSTEEAYEDGYAGGNMIISPGVFDAADGEVEDYQVLIVEEARDYGDAPDGIAGLAYPTLISSNGASHAVGALMLGDDIDADYDAHSNATATGDDLTCLDGWGYYGP